MTCYEDLMYRGLIKDMTNNEDFVEKLNSGEITFYWGTDPTADSLHIGHYSSLLTAKRLMKYGHKPILLVGGATVLIGDPRPTAEREIIDKNVVLNNIECIRKQVTELFNGNVEVVNNYDWIKEFSFIDFLRDVGKYINVNYMLNKDIISRRLETGITFAEFSYTLLQGYDFVHLYKEKNCIMQAAGSDQWGNITTGVELINKMLGKTAYAFTMPLILDANGNKFGKSEGNALWLDESKTSSYELYQYLINSDDTKVEEYLKVFTFLSKEEIEEVMRKHNEKPELRIAQKTLAKEFITDLHGEESYNRALKLSEGLFSGNIKEINLDDLLIGLKDMPHFELKESTLIDLLVNEKIASSRREAREFINGNAISINGDIVNDENMIINKDTALDGRVVIIRRGKKKYFVGSIN